MKLINISLVVATSVVVVLCATFIAVLRVLSVIDDDQTVDAAIKTGVILLILLVAGLVISALTRSPKGKM